MEYCSGRPYAPKDTLWDEASRYWQSLRSDEAAVFDRERVIDISSLQPQLSWGTSPQHCIDWNGTVPRPSDASDADQAAAWERAQTYMGVQAGSQLSDYPIDAAFIGSCTNSRLSDLRAAAGYLRRTGARVAKGLRPFAYRVAGR